MELIRIVEQHRGVALPKASKALVTPMAAVLDGLRIDPARDTFKIIGSSTVMAAHVTKPDGTVVSARVRADGSLKQITAFDPSTLSVEGRRRLERDMYKGGLSQAEIANLLGVSQATVSLDLKKIKAGR